jgi:hypothetical protein
MTEIPELNQNQKMLLLLARMGSPPRVLEFSYDLCADLPILTADQRRYTFGPVVFHNLGRWTDPEFVNEWKAMIYEERLKIAFGQMPGHRVGPTEIMIVMHSRSMEAPMGHTMTQIYLWASTAAAVSRWGKERGPGWVSSLPKPDYTDEAFLLAGGRMHHEYVALTDEIRRKVIRHSEARGRRKFDPPALVSVESEPAVA